jgi:hypothetical protein
MPALLYRPEPKGDTAMRIHTFWLASAAVAALLPLVLWGQIHQPETGKKNTLSVENLMSAAEFKSCGLTKLSPEELNHLNAWLLTYSSRLAGVVQEAAVPKTADAIESQIDGEFHGWDGETIFKLRNGQIWQQAEYDYTYEYAYSPDVTIYKTAGGYKMKVEDVEDTIYVKRIK